MSAAKALRELACGPTPAISDDEFAKMLDAVGRQIEDYASFVSVYKSRPSDKDSSYFLPLALRSVMEASCTGVLARIDPYRVMYAAKAQLTAAYDRSSQQASSLKWSGDMVLGGEVKTGGAKPAKPSVPSAPATPPVPPAPPAPSTPAATVQAANSTLVASWEPNLGREKIPRAIFSLNMYEVLWNPAHKKFTDWFVSTNSTASVCSDLAALSSHQVRDLFTVKGSKLYSELSKGIHPEFIISRQAEFDAATLTDLSERTVAWVTQMAVLTHFSSLSNTRLDVSRLLDQIESIQGDLLS